MIWKKLTKALLNNRMIVIIFAVTIMIAGFISYYLIPKQENPNTAVAAAIITTVYPGASPQEVEQNVTNVIEDKLMSINNLDSYTSMSMNSASVIVLMYDFDVSIGEVEDDLRRDISDIQSSLPDMVTPSVVNTNVVSENQFIISLSGENYTDTDLEEYAKNTQSILQEVKGIESVNIDGIKPKQVVIETNSEKMRSYGISIENIIQLMQAQNLSIPSGSIDYESGTVNVITPAVFESLRDIENTVISGSDSSLSFVRLKDIADVYIEDVEEFSYSQDGVPCILITGTIQEGENAVNVGEDLRNAIDEAKNLMPPDLNFYEVMYAPADIEQSINDFIMNLLQSILLIVIVVMIGVHLRNGLIVSIALPLSILITFIVMMVIGVEFHFISIAALIVSLGILVDNAIVISEAIQQHLNEGKDKNHAIISGVKETAVPVFTSTLTTVVTFGIIYFVPGPVGQIAGEIPTVVITALVASYIVAMCVIPVLASFFFHPESKKQKEKKNYLKDFFNKMLTVALKHKVLTVLSSFLTLGIAAVLALQLGIQFFPVSDKPILYVNFEAETMSLDSSEDISEQINDVLDSNPLIENYTYAIGKGLPSFFLTVPTLNQAPNVGQYMINLNPELMDEYGGPEECARLLQNELDTNIIGAQNTVRCLEYSMPTEAKITLSVLGDDMDKILNVSDQIVAALKEIEGTDFVRSTNIAPQYDYNVVLDSDVLASYGLLKYDVVKQINSSLMGVNAGVYLGGNSGTDIIVRSDVKSLDELENLQIVGSVTPTKVLLGQIAEIQLNSSVPLIEHYNGKKYVNVLSDILPGFSSISIESELYSDYLDQIDLDGVEIIGNGEVSNMMDLLLSLGSTSIVAVFVIYMILVFQFKDLKKPLIVLSSIPLSFIGCGFGLWIFKMDIQAMALLGLVSLFGIVVNNSILLIEVMNSEFQEGCSVEEACHRAVDRRFRPIMLSTVTTCIGLVPLILSGDPMTAPMASVLLFGLLFSTILTMVVVPTIYALQNKKKAIITPME